MRLRIQIDADGRVHYFTVRSSGIVARMENSYWCPSYAEVASQLGLEAIRGLRNISQLSLWDGDQAMVRNLTAMGYSNQDIAQAITVQYGFPFLSLENYEINHEALKLIPENVAKQYNLVPVDKIGEMITIAMSNPLNAQAIEDVEMITKCEVQIFITTMSAINNSIKKYYGNPVKR